MNSMKMYFMNKGGLSVWHYYKETLKHIRKVDKRFHNAKIKSVLQLQPTSIKVGIVYHEEIYL